MSLAWRVDALPLAAVVLISLAGASEALAWAEKGHRVVGHLAEGALTPEAAATVEQLLQSEPEPSLAGVAAWADSIRRSPEFPFSGLGHFIEIPLSAAGGSLRPYCPNNDCLAASLGAVRRALADDTIEPAKRVVALKFLVHLVADAHQPLHCASNRDRGANQVRVLYRSQAMSLHAAWDSAFVRDIEGDFRAVAAEIRAAVTPEDVRDWTSATDIPNWLWECFTTAKTVAYARPKLVTPDPDRAVTLDEDYIRTAQATIRRQLGKAGVRLAAELNRLGPTRVGTLERYFFGAKPADPSSPPRPAGPSPAATSAPSGPMSVPPAPTPPALVWPWVVGGAGAGVAIVGAGLWRRRRGRRRVFVSYRRNTSEGYAGRIGDHLVREFGRRQVFRDVDSIPAGADFAKAIEHRMAACDAVVAVLGPGWETDPRLDDAHDFVRRELEGALRSDVLVIPVLVQGATMPPVGALPEDLRALGGRQAITVVDQLFDAALAALTRAIKEAPRR